MEERIIIRRGEGKLLSVDPETHQAIRAWVNMEGTTMVNAVRVMVRFYLNHHYGGKKGDKKGERLDPILRSKYIELIDVIEGAKKKVTGKGLKNP